MKVFSALKLTIALTGLSLTMIASPSVAEFRVQQEPQAKQQQIPQIEAQRTAIYGSHSKFTSTDTITRYTYDDTYLGSYINAPLQSVQVLHFNQSPNEVFEWVTSGNDEWTLSVETLTWDHTASETPGELGVGSVRRCDFYGGVGTAYERVYAIEENRLLAYDLDTERSNAPLPVKDFFVIWTVEDKGPDGTLVVARMYYHEAQEARGQAATGVAQALAVDFKNFANTYGGTYVKM